MTPQFFELERVWVTFSKKNLRQSSKYAEIYVTWQVFGASGAQGHFFEKIKEKQFLDMVKGRVCTEFQVSIVFRLVRG